MFNDEDVVSMIAEEYADVARVGDGRAILS